MNRPLWLLIALYIALIGSAAQALHHNLSTGIFDLGIHVQTIWLRAQGLPDFLTTRGLAAGADHFTPFLTALAALNLTSSEALLWLQTLVLASGAWPTYYLAKKELEQHRPALAFAAVYLLQPGLWGCNLFDFHPTSLAAPILMWALWSMRTRRWLIYTTALTILVTLGEALGITVVCLSFEVWRNKNRKAALATLAWGIACLAYARASLGPSQYGALYQGFQVHELKSGALYLGLIFLSFGGLPLLSIQRTLPAWPVILGNLLTWRSAQRVLSHHYMAAILPFMLWAAIGGYKRRPLHPAALVALLIFTLSIHGGRLASALAPSPQLKILTEKIPADASLAADNHPGAGLATRKNIYLFPNPMQSLCWGNRPQALVEQLNQGGDPPTPGSLRRSLEAVGPDWLLLQSGDHWPLHQLDRAYWFREIARNQHIYQQVESSGNLTLWQRRLPSVETRPYQEIHPRIAADASTIVYEKQGQIVAYDLKSKTLKTIAPGYHPDISSDGQQIAFISESDTLTPGDSNVSADVFVYSQGKISRRAGVGETARVSAYWPRFHKDQLHWIGYGKKRHPQNSAKPSTMDSSIRYLGYDQKTTIAPDGSLPTLSLKDGYYTLPGIEPDPQVDCFELTTSENGSHFAYTRAPRHAPSQIVLLQQKLRHLINAPAPGHAANPSVSNNGTLTWTQNQKVYYRTPDGYIQACP